MGRLVYGGHHEVVLDDRTLRHFQVVIEMKLRRRESFALSWTGLQEWGGGHGSLWISPGVPISFHYEGDPGPVNRPWVDLLLAGANAAGLRAIAEPPFAR